MSEAFKYRVKSFLAGYVCIAAVVAVIVSLGLLLFSGALFFLTDELHIFWQAYHLVWAAPFVIATFWVIEDWNSPSIPRKPTVHN